MSLDTTYSVNIKYAVDNRAGRAGTQALNQDVKQLERSSKSASSGLLAMGVAAIAAFGARAAGGALVGFNAQVQDTRLQIAGMLALSKKTDLADEFGNADRVFANLQKRAASLPGTTMEYARMAGMLTQPIMDAGLSLKDLEDLTVNAVVGAKALGIEWQVAARDVDQALRGQFHAPDVFTGKLLAGAGFKGEEGRAKFNAMNADKRAAELKRALTQKQLEQLAAAQGQTFTGVMSTLSDSIQQTLGKVGLPLFKAISAEIVRWNKWMDINALKVEKIARDLGQGLADGFRVVKDALGFLVEHKDSLLAIGKVWLALKIGTAVGGFLGDGAKGGQGKLKALMAWGRGAHDEFDPETGEYKHTKAGAGRTKVGMGNIAGSLPLLGQSLALGYAFGTLINDATGLSSKIADLGIDATTKRFEALERSSTALGDAMDRAAAAAPNASRAVTNLKGAGANYAQLANLAGDAMRGVALDMNSAVDESVRAQKLKELDKLGVTSEDIDKAGGLQAFADSMAAKAQELGDRQAALTELGIAAYTQGFAQLTDYQRETLDTGKAQHDLFEYINSHGLMIDPESILRLMRADTNDPTGKHKPLADKPTVNVHIARIEVQSNDPDRMAFGLIESLRDAAKNPSSAFSTVREG